LLFNIKFWIWIFLWFDIDFAYALEFLNHFWQGFIIDLKLLKFNLSLLMFLLTDWDSVDILSDDVVESSLKFNQKSVSCFESIVDVSLKLSDNDEFVDQD